MSIIKIIGTRLYQWEVGRQLQIIPLPNHTVASVHFSNPGDLEALVVKPKELNGMIVADIPNILLQNGKNINVHTVDVSETYAETLMDCELHVRRRSKPSNYVYTETDVLNYSNLDKRLRKVETAGGAINGIPPGGKAGQFLCKQSDDDYDVGWADFKIPEQYGLVTYDQDKTITIT